MEFILVLSLIIFLSVQGIQARLVWKIGQQLEKATDELLLLRSRQSHIASMKNSTGTPIVDAAARTTRRDSNDLPATGRMSIGVHTERKNAKS